MRPLKSALLILMLMPAAGYAEPGPSQVVEAFHQALLDAMQAANYPDREQIIEPAVAAGFNLQTIARISLGRNWRSLSKSDQQAFQSLLGQLITSTYASRFDHYDGQYFETIGEEPIASERVRVRTTLTTSKEIVNLDYQLQSTDSGWHIYDIVANGVSDLALKRSNYTAMFNEGGLPLVISDIRQNISRNQPETPRQ